MEKEIRKFKVDFNFNWTYGVEIKKLKEDLDILEKLGVTEIDIEAEEDYGSYSVKIAAYINRLETDEECKLRINKKIEQQKRVEEFELRQLETLKNKYNK